MAKVINDAISQTHTSERILVAEKALLLSSYIFLKNKWMYFNSSFYITSDAFIVDITFFE